MHKLISKCTQREYKITILATLISFTTHKHHIAVLLNLWVTTTLGGEPPFPRTQGSPKTIGKHRYLLMIHNSSKIIVMK